MNIGVLSKLNIRKATSQETKQILDYSPTVMKESTMGFFEGNKKTSFQMISQILSHGGYYLVYVENKEIQGWIGVGRSYSFFTNEMEGMISELYVLPRYRKKGIAKRLIDHSIEIFKTSGLKKVQLNVYSGNFAKKLYDKLGFYDMYTVMEKDLLNNSPD